MAQNGSGAMPPAMAIALAAVTAARTGTGQRRRAAIGTHTTYPSSRCWPRSSGCGPARVLSVISATQTASTATADSRRWLSAAGRGPRHGVCAMESLATTVTVTGAPAERIVPEDDGLAGEALSSGRLHGVVPGW